MKKLFSAMTFIAIVGLFSLVSCEKDIVPQTTQGLEVTHYENNPPNSLVAVGEKGISTGPGGVLSFETYENIMHVKVIECEFISNSPEPITAITLSVQNNWSPNLVTTKAVKNKKVKLTGDFIIKPGVGATFFELIPSYAGIGKNSKQGEKIEMRITKIERVPEKDNRPGQMNPEIKFSLGTVVASAPQIYPSVWNPYTQSRIYLPRRTGKADFAIITVQVDGLCSFKNVKMMLDLEGMFLNPSKEVTIRDMFSGAVAKTTVLSTSGGEFSFKVPTPLSTQNGTRFFILSGEIDSITWGANQSITTKNLGFEWKDHLGGDEYSTENFSMMWHRNGYNSLTENYATLDW